jgi:hypothetical protein
MNFSVNYVHELVEIQIYSKIEEKKVSVVLGDAFGS